MKEKVIQEIKSIFWTSLYFFIWFGGLMVIKVLLLREYQIEFVGLTMVIVSSLVVAKVVLVLECVRIPFSQGQQVWFEVLVRTMLYISGVFVVLVLEKSFEARHEYGGMLEAMTNLADHSDIYHIWVNVISVSGALLLFNMWTIVKNHYGADMFLKLMRTPVPQKINATTTTGSVSASIEN
jgi:hypothetical protein